MTLTFYKQAGDPKRVDKSKFLSKVGVLENVYFIEESGLVNPRFVLQTKSMVYQSNYAFCDFTNRYYFLGEPKAIDGGRIEIEGTCDVLFTYREEILSSPAWIKSSSKTSSIKDFDFLHNDYPLRADYDIKGKDFVGGEIRFDQNIMDDSTRCAVMIIK